MFQCNTCGKLLNDEQGCYNDGKPTCVTCIKESYHHDPVNHPSHYKGKGLECIQVIKAFDLNFELGNAVKYILRAGKKGSKKEDLQKAIWYLTSAIQDLDENEPIQQP